MLMLYVVRLTNVLNLSDSVVAHVECIQKLQTIQVLQLGQHVLLQISDSKTSQKYK